MGFMGVPSCSLLYLLALTQIPIDFYVIFVTDYQIDTVRRAERACRGFVTIDGTEKLSLFVAMKRGLVVESRGLRYVLVIFVSIII